MKLFSTPPYIASAEGGGTRSWPSPLVGGNSGTPAPDLQAVAGCTAVRSSVKLPWSWPVAALALGQGNGERDAELLADASSDMPVASQVFGHQHVARGEPSLAPISRLKFREA